MKLSRKIRLFVIATGLVLIFENLGRHLLGFDLLVGRDAWVHFSGGVIALLAGVYGGAGHYKPNQEP